jgi:hypothetical protein
VTRIDFVAPGFSPAEVAECISPAQVVVPSKFMKAKEKGKKECRNCSKYVAAKS